jgi:hypothetical protein
LTRRVGVALAGALLALPPASEAKVAPFGHPCTLQIPTRERPTPQNGIAAPSEPR